MSEELSSRFRDDKAGVEGSTTLVDVPDDNGEDDEEDNDDDGDDNDDIDDAALPPISTTAGTRSTSPILPLG